MNNDDRIAAFGRAAGLCLSQVKEAIERVLDAFRSAVGCIAELRAELLSPGETKPASLAVVSRPQWSYRYRLAYATRAPLPNVTTSHERRFRRHYRRKAIPK